MKLSNKLVLFRYILKQFGYEEFEEISQEFNSQQETTNFALIISGKTDSAIKSEKIFQYDASIRVYEQKLKQHSTEPFLSLKYYQWFSLLFTEYFFDRYTSDKERFLKDLNNFKSTEPGYFEMEDFIEKDLKKLAFWMATGSGKTLIMHCNYWQILSYVPNWENIILITPNEGLSRQHYESLCESGIPAKLYSGSEESLKTRPGEILIIEITKLVKGKEGEGVSVDVDYFAESKNLIFIDEGHKGQRSEERAWKNLRDYLTRSDDSFTFEYSATFGQIISDSTPDLLNEYSKSIIFDYSYRYFYGDGYGKDFSVYNIEAKNGYDQEQSKILFTASLLGFYEQLALFDIHKENIRKYNIEKPLWIFVGSKVVGSSSSLTQADKQNISDVSNILNFFKFVLTEPEELGDIISRILDERTGLNDPNGDDIFSGKFKHLKSNGWSVDEIVNKVFSGAGNFEALQIRQADGEIGLRTKTSDRYFAVVNIGDVPKYLKKLEEDTNNELTILEDKFTKSLFNSISTPDSSINILIGSKKFIEGWNSWRVSSMGLMNMGKSEGPQIIQLFGRGVRLKGQNYSLKRDINAPYHIKTLQTISIVGLNASYMNRFLEQIENEVPEYQETSLKIRFNHEEKWNKNLVTFKSKGGGSFKDEIIEITYIPKIAGRVTIDLRTRVSVAVSGFNSRIAENELPYDDKFLKTYCNFIDYNKLYLDADVYRLAKRYSNLILHSGVIEKIIKEAEYQYYSNSGQFTIVDVFNGKLQNIAGTVVKDYITKFYSEKEKQYLSKTLTYALLDHDVQTEMFPSEQQILIKIPKKFPHLIEELRKNIEAIFSGINKTIFTLHFGNHLYSPLTIYTKSDKMEIKTVPTRLNEGETQFLYDLHNFIRSNQPEFNSKDVFVLRNLSVRGIGFLIESSSFFPDFILWIVEENKQRIIFVDPKGIRETRNFNNPKVIFCREQTTDIQTKINDDLLKDGKNIQVTISAYILSVTKFKDISPIWESGNVELEEFTKNNILFMEDKDEYLEKLFELSSED